MSNLTSPANPWPPALPSAPQNPNDLTDALKSGMIPVSIFAICSALSTFALLVWITWRLIFRSDYQAFSGYNQYVILIYNLLLADLQQALAFIITLHWLDIGQIASPSRTCFTQGFLLNMGDVSSGFFVFAIALHTWYSVVLGRKLKYAFFTVGILLIWTFAFFLTIIGPATKGSNFYAKTNAWCWVNSKYDLWRLWVHYIWVFIVEFGTIIIYAHIFLHLRKRLRSIRSVAGSDPAGPVRTARLSQAARYMVLYPVIYVLLTLPLATGRMVTMSGKNLPISFYCVAGSFLTSCGWLDTLLYTLTRRVFVKPDTAITHHTTRAATAVTSKSQHSAKRWLRSRDRKAEDTPDVPTRNMDDSNWHLSTFASVTGDMNDYGMAKNAGISSNVAEISSRSSSPSSSGPSRNESPGATMTQTYNPKGGQPRSRCGTPNTTNNGTNGNSKLKSLARTETTISSSARDSQYNASDKVNTADFASTFRLPPMGNSILSETKIEVVSVLRDDFLGGHGFSGLLHRDGGDKSGGSNSNGTSSHHSSGNGSRDKLSLFTSSKDKKDDKDKDKDKSEKS